MADDEDEFYDSESEPSLLGNELDLSNKLNNISISLDKSLTKSTCIPIYAVQFTNKSKNSNNNNLTASQNCNRIFINQENAMKLCKQDPDNRRFKVFKNFQEAYAFSYETSEIESGQAPSMAQIQASLSLPVQENKLNFTNKITDTNTNSNTKPSTQDAEKLPFSAPKKPEVNEMRLFIERNNFEQFCDKAVANPRFLITAGESPVVYQEGFRYNALHCCAKENRPNICQLILNLLNSTSYLQKMFRNDTLDQSRARSHHLLDLYLNTPEKGLNETPLHFATKFGSYEVARLLISFDICAKNAKNKFGKTADEIICTKATTQAAKDKYNAIKSLFEECYYVPLFRDDEKGDVQIEKPSPKLETNFEMNKSNFDSPLKTSLSQAQRKLAGYVGPVSPTVANEIYERLKSPAKLRRSPNNLDIIRSDDFKGYERILRKLTDEMNLPWCEYWGFMDSYCNLKSKEGLEKLEIYLGQKKFLSLLEIQIKSAKMIKNDQLNNNNNDNISNNENENRQQLIVKLDFFIKTIEQLKSNLELKENLLSQKYEHFVLKMSENQSNLSNLFLTQSKSEEYLNENDLNEYDVYNILNQYMSIIIELSRLDKTSKCYFSLYKTSKNLLDLLNCQKLFDNFYLSPIFKRIINTIPNINKPLTNTTNLKNWMCNNTNLENIKSSYQIQKPLFDDSDDEDENLTKNDSIKKIQNDQDDDYLDDQQEKMYEDADDSIVDHIKQNRSLTDELESVTLKMSSDFLNQNTNNLKKPQSNNPFSITIEDGSNKKTDEEDNDYKLNDVNNKFVNNNLFNNISKEKYKLFMFGDVPSKLDRAVFFAIQNANLDSNKFKLLNEWYNFMRSFKQSDMQKWKTPMRQNNLFARTRFLN